ncbi:uncharacterized protein RCC_02020 [Ramularia collo-cygni]|uniref:Uncharacterized protein n=1 Tax=Ramularia collo-cygni TaxID=112498 RepID=A0A2D3UQ06_9PEZI|nr:uncharacterized protein RCC_02020 [Ramularia collo-cygni]CZT16178.1 uncharacterized protein RCC_02020 [Ramularia collo-cygni]
MVQYIQTPPRSQSSTRISSSLEILLFSCFITIYKVQATGHYWQFERLYSRHEPHQQSMRSEHEVDKDAASRAEFVNKTWLRESRWHKVRLWKRRKSKSGSHPGAEERGEERCDATGSPYPQLMAGSRVANSADLQIERKK